MLHHLETDASVTVILCLVVALQKPIVFTSPLTLPSWCFCFVSSRMRQKTMEIKPHFVYSWNPFEFYLKFLEMIASFSGISELDFSAMFYRINKMNRTVQIYKNSNISF
jgi:hypothetical protein